MENDSRKRIVDKMFQAAMREKLSRLARKYDSDVLLKVWARLSNGEGIEARFKEKWNEKMTIEQALDALEQYFNSVERSYLAPHERV